MDPGAPRTNGPRASVGDFRAPLYERYVSDFKAGRGNAVGSFAWWDHKYLPLLAGVDRTAPLLELGCGDGGLLAYLAQRGFSGASGIDISGDQVALAHRRGVRAEIADALEYLGARANTYAAIVAVDFLEHFGRAELLRLAALLCGALRPGGRILIQTANGAGLLAGQVMYGDLTHMTILTPDSIGQLLRPAGFGAIHCYETGPVPIRLRGKLDVAVWSAVKLLASALKYVETGKRQRIWTENFICCAARP